MKMGGKQGVLGSKPRGKQRGELRRKEQTGQNIKAIAEVTVEPAAKAATPVLWMVTKLAQDLLNVVAVRFERCVKRDDRQTQSLLLNETDGKRPDFPDSLTRAQREGEVAPNRMLRKERERIKIA